jgi:hypothetical protein
MTLPVQYSHHYVPVKYFLNSYRAISDGRNGVRQLEQLLQSSQPLLVSDWKVIWIGTCTVLRTSIDLFKLDAKSCIDQSIRREIQAEWDSIRSNMKLHPIFWEFLRKERDNIIHQYEWSAYEVWIGQDGVTQPARMSLFEVKPSDASSVLIMRHGQYKDRNSLDLLKESADWAEARIFDAIRRAGFDPNESRSLGNFQKPPPTKKVADQ